MMKHTVTSFVFFGILGLSCSQGSLISSEERPATENEISQTVIPAPKGVTFEAFRTAFTELKLPLSIPALDSGWIQNRQPLPNNLATKFYDPDSAAKYYAIGRFLKDEREFFIIRKTVKSAEQYYAKIYLVSFNKDKKVNDSELIGGYEYIDFDKVPTLTRNQALDGHNEAYYTWNSTITEEAEIKVEPAVSFFNSENNEVQHVSKGNYALELLANGLIDKVRNK